VVALIDDHVTVAGDDVVDLPVTDKTLDHGDINVLCWPALPTTNLADFLRIEPEEQGDLGAPLIEQGTSVYENQRVPSPLDDQPDSYHCLPDAWRSNEDPNLVLEKSLHGLPLNRSQLASESQAQRLSRLTLILNIEGNSVARDQIFEITPAPSRQGNVLGQLFRAGDHSRGQCRRQPHALLLVELGVLEGRQALDLVQQGGGKADLVHEETLREHGANHLWQGFGGKQSSGVSRRRMVPGCRGITIIRQINIPNPYDPIQARRLPRNIFRCGGLDPLKRCQVGPLVSARGKVVVQENRIAPLTWPVLEGKRDEIPEASARHRVLVREETVVGGHAELVVPGHAFCDEIAAHLSRNAGRDGRREEEPDVSTVTRPRSLHGGGDLQSTTGLRERECVVRPGALVEIHSQEPAALVLEKRIDADDVTPAQMIEDDLVSDRDECLVRAFATSDSRLFTDAAHPLVRAGRSVPFLSGFGIEPQPGKDILSAAE
jgi:hypothetical protein